MKILQATSSHAPLIGASVVDAIGEHIALGLAGDRHTLQDVRDMFAALASRDDTQYSYCNTLVAVDNDGSPMGVCVAYDGARLEQLRQPFFTEVKNRLGWDLTDVEDECEAGEYYIDTLAVLPQYRGCGVAAELLKATIAKAAEMGKPAGLLVDRNNTAARRLYDRIGFVKVGDRPFVHVMMDHLQYPRP